MQRDPFRHFPAATVVGHDMDPVSRAASASLKRKIRIGVPRGAGNGQAATTAMVKRAGRANARHTHNWRL
jgi:hypothetical protein